MEMPSPSGLRLARHNQLKQEPYKWECWANTGKMWSLFVLVQNVYRVHKEIKLNIIYFAAQVFHYTQVSRPKISKKEQNFSY